MPLKVYEYPVCSTCKKALQFLDKNKIPYEKIHIVEQPPSLAELKNMLILVKAKGGSLKSLFNTSGLLYKELKLAERFESLSEKEALDLLAKHGKLIKRPFVLAPKQGLVGFREAQWCDALLSSSKAKI